MRICVQPLREVSSALIAGEALLRAWGNQPLPDDELVWPLDRAPEIRIRTARLALIGPLGEDIEVEWGEFIGRFESVDWLLMGFRAWRVWIEKVRVTAQTMLSETPNRSDWDPELFEIASRLLQLELDGALEILDEFELEVAMCISVSNN